jgi:excisionase family DNA binding protein
MSFDTQIALLGCDPLYLTPLAADSMPRGYTPRELAKILRVSPDRVRSWIRSGELPALNLASHQCGKPRFVILPHHLATFEQSRQAVQPRPTPRRRRQSDVIDWYPG